jgi:hypothetical protein
LHEFINENLNSDIVKSITHHSKYLDIFKACFNV